MVFAVLRGEELVLVERRCWWRIRRLLFLFEAAVHLKLSLLGLQLGSSDHDAAAPGGGGAIGRVPRGSQMDGFKKELQENWA